MHPTIGKIKAYLEVWYTSNAGLPVHVASFQIYLGDSEEDARERIKRFEDQGSSSCTEPVQHYIESLEKNDYQLTFKTQLAA